VIYLGFDQLARKWGRKKETGDAPPLSEPKDLQPSPASGGGE
jgi:hypothetical protein